MEEIELPQHEHFSIRGFVAGVRKKNLKMCSPFPSEIDAGDRFANDLPTLSVPKFRWWSCSHCVPEITTERFVPEMVLRNQNDNTSTSSYGAGRGEKDHRSKKTDVPENRSLGSDGGFGAVPHRRKKKLRSLADIMEEETEKKSENGNLRTGSISSSATHTASLTIKDDAQLRMPPEGRKQGPNLRRKKMSAFEQGRRNLETVKRLRRHVAEPEAEKNSRRVEISDSEAETVASPRSDLQYSSKKKRIKPKKGRRKLRQVNNGKISVVLRSSPELNAAVSENLGRHITASDSGFSFTAPAASNGELPNSTKTNVVAHSDTRDNVLLDLSLNDERNVPKEQYSVEHRGIPDLNEAITEIPLAIQESQLPIFSEQRSLSFDKIPENSWHVPESHNEEPLGASDDIPMEIVELLAKKQQERMSENFSHHFPPSSSGRYLLDGKVSFPFADRNNGFSRGFLSFPQGKYFQLEAGNSKGKQFMFFDPETASQQRNTTEYSRSNSVIPVSPVVSNVDIPAMQLLSLTNRRTPTGFPFHSSFQDKQHSSDPSENENRMLLGSPFLSLGFNRYYLQQAQMPSHHLVARSIPKHLPSSEDPSLRVCILNRNPADFTVIDARNEYLINAKDLKLKKRSALKQGSAPFTPNPKKKWVRRNFSRDQEYVQPHYNLQKQYKSKKSRKNTQKNNA